MKYRKKPVVIDAIQWTGENTKEVLAFSEVAYELGYGVIMIPTLEGNMLCKVGDWVIRGIAGEYYPCKPEIFEQIYEEVK